MVATTTTMMMTVMKLIAVEGQHWRHYEEAANLLALQTLLVALRGPEHSLFHWRFLPSYCAPTVALIINARTTLASARCQATPTR